LSLLVLVLEIRRGGLPSALACGDSRVYGGGYRVSLVVLAVCCGVVEARRLWLVDVFLGDPSRFGSSYLVFVLGLLGCGDGLVLWRFWFLCSRLPLLTLEVGSFMSLSIVLWFSKATAGVASFASLLASVSRSSDETSANNDDDGRVIMGILLRDNWFRILLRILIASTLLPLSQNPLNQGLKNDRYYYCFLVPLTIPVITVAVYFHWLSMKLFKHA
ncbi:hypothetical protein HID58_047456, partial [Brassica napus]